MKKTKILFLFFVFCVPFFSNAEEIIKDSNTNYYSTVQNNVQGSYANSLDVGFGVIMRFGNYTDTVIPKNIYTIKMPVCSNSFKGKMKLQAINFYNFQLGSLISEKLSNNDIVACSQLLADRSNWLTYTFEAGIPVNDLTLFTLVYDGTSVLDYTYDYPSDLTWKIDRGDITNQSATFGFGAYNADWHGVTAVIYSQDGIQCSVSGACSDPVTNYTPNWYMSTVMEVPQVVNGVCSQDKFLCLSGSSVNNVTVGDMSSWDCVGLYGGSSESCTYVTSTSTPTTTLPVYPTTETYECGITSGDGIVGCLKNAFNWAFVPSQSSFNDFISLSDKLKTKAPIGYITSFIGVFKNIDTSSSTVSLGLISTDTVFYDLIFKPIRAMMVIVFMLFGAVWLFRRTKDIKI